MTPTRLLASIPLALWLGGVAFGQIPRHSLTSVSPAGGQVGSTVTVEVAGTEIDPNVHLRFDHPGIRAFRMTGNRFAVAIAPDVPPGQHDVRLSGALGLSAPRTFDVRIEPSLVETEPKDTVDVAQSISLPVRIDGRMNAAADIDSFSFEGTAGSTISAELTTLGMDSRLDGVLRLISPTGRTLLGPSDLRGPEPSFTIRLPESGRYVLQVHDLVYGGSADHGYSLVVRPGSQPKISESATPPGVIAEVEAGPSETARQTFTGPCEVLAAFDRPGDVDSYLLAAKKGDSWIVEVLADRLGSACDPEFTIRRLVETGPAIEVVAGDDTADPFVGKRFPIGSLDPISRFDAPETGTYEIMIHDRDGSPRVSDSPLPYRLRIRPEQPDFDLFIVPGDATNPEATSLRSGGRATAFALVNRRDRLAGPILVEARDLPPGVTCESVIVAANAVMAPVVLTSEAGMPALDGSIRFVGRNISGDRKELLDHTPGRRVRPETEHDAIPGVMVWPMPAAVGDAPAIARARPTTEFAVSVREGAPFRLTAFPAFAVVGQGDSIELTADVTRMNGMVGEINVKVAELPAGLTAPPAAKIEKDKTKVTLTLKVPKDVPAGLYSFILRGTGPFPFSKDPNAKEKPNVNVDEPSNIVTIRVRP